MASQMRRRSASEPGMCTSSARLRHASQTEAPGSAHDALCQDRAFRSGRSDREDSNREIFTPACRKESIPFNLRWQRRTFRECVPLQQRSQAGHLTVDPCKMQTLNQRESLSENPLAPTNPNRCAEGRSYSVEETTTVCRPGSAPSPSYDLLPTIRAWPAVVERKCSQSRGAFQGILPLVPITKLLAHAAIMFTVTLRACILPFCRFFPPSSLRFLRRCSLTHSCHKWESECQVHFLLYICTPP
eukprot:3644806-Rhodomonas_salina.2